MRKVLLAISLLVPLFVANTAFASTEVFGTLPSDTTWTLTDSPYVITNDLSIPAGVTLTVEPGVVVKFHDSFTTLNIDGDLEAIGTASAPIIFTAYKDDTAGGDTNGDGSASFPGTFTFPPVSDWRAIFFNAGSVSHIAHASIRYGGQIFFNGFGYQRNPMIRNDGGTLFMDSTDLNPGPYASEAFNQTDGSTTVTDSHSTYGRVFVVSSGTFAIHGSTFAQSSDAIINSNATTIDATNNWWGDASGPTHPNNPDGTGSRITGDVSFVPFLTTDPTAATITLGDAVAPTTGNATTPLTFKVIYINSFNQPPTSVRLVATGDNSPCPAMGGGPMLSALFVKTAYAAEGDRCAMEIDGSAAATLHDGNFANGEQYTLTQQFPAGNYNYHFEADTMRTPEFDEVALTVSDGPAPCTKNCNSNVLFLPGLEASRLFWTDPNCLFLNCENQLWLANNDADAEKLYLNPNGTSILGDIYTSVERGAIDEAAIPVVGTNIYKTFLNRLGEWKNDEQLIADYAVTPYDWRLSVDDVLTKGIKNGDNIYYGDTNGTYILDELLRMASTSRTQKVTIVAHSNGGLVAKQLMLKLRELGKEGLVDRLILVAVPQVGTPKAVGGLLHGTDLGLPFILDEERARTMGENMPSAYALMPSQRYFETVNPNSVTSKLISFTDSPLYAPERSQYGFLVSNMAELRGYLLGSEGRTEPADADLDSPNVLKSELLDQASSTHALLDEWQPASATEVVQIAGWGEETISGVSYYAEQQRDCVTVQGQFGASHQECGPYYDVKKYKPNFTTEGDGTVVTPSALWMSTTTPRVERYWVDLKKYNDENIDKDHSKILEVSDLLDFIKNKLTNTTSPLPTYLANSTSTLSDVPDTKFVYTLHSPLSLDLYDTLGNHTGVSTTTGYAEENIPGSRYGTFGEVKYIISSADVAQHLELRGYATGTFSLDIELVVGDTVLASTTFASVPVSPSTIATFSLPANGDFSSSTPLQIDVDGNGANDFVLVPQIGATVYPDLAPPEAIFSFDAVTKDAVIFGADNGGTTSALTTPTSTTITDLAGNTLTVSFIKFKEKPTKLKIVFDTLIYNGVATVTPRVTIEYEWEVKHNGTLKSLSQDIRIKGVRRVTTEYSVGKNETKIVDRINEDGGKSVMKTTKTGVATLVLSTNAGTLDVTY